MMFFSLFICFVNPLFYVLFAFLSVYLTNYLSFTFSWSLHSVTVHSSSWNFQSQIDLFSSVFCISLFSLSLFKCSCFVRSSGFHVSIFFYFCLICLLLFSFVYTSNCILPFRSSRWPFPIALFSPFFSLLSQPFPLTLLHFLSLYISLCFSLTPCLLVHSLAAAHRPP